MTRNAIQHLLGAVLQQDPAGPTDGELLSRFVERRDEAAFEALVRRHGSMVWGVCRRVLTSHQDAEDAFQATFLVLARKAAAVVPRAMVANWLYGVAHQAALHAARTAARRNQWERQVTSMPEPAVTDNDPWPDLQPILDQELSRLPDKYRAVVVLCDLEGKGRKEAARQLGCPEGTVAGRLARARAMLAKRLTRRGVTLSSAALAVVLSQKAASGCAPVSVIASTIKSTSLIAAGQVANGVTSANVAILTERVLKMMLINRLRKVTIGLLVLAAFALGGGLLVHQATAGQEKPQLPSGVLPGTQGERSSGAVPNEARKEAPPADAGQQAQKKEPEKEEPAKLQGIWKLTEFIPGGERNRVLIKLETKDAKLGAELVVAKQFSGGKLKDFRVEGKTISFTIDSPNEEFTFEGRLTGDGKKILGMFRFRIPRGGIVPGADNGPAMLTPTNARIIGDRDLMVQNLDLNKAMRMTGKERITAIQDLLKKDPDSPAVLWVVHQALRLSAREKDVGLDYKDLVNRADAVASAGGPALERREAMLLAELLANIGQTDLALEQAHRAEKLLAKDAPLSEQASFLTLLETVLKTAGKEDQLKEVRGRLKKIEAELDKQYLASVPIKPTPSTMHPKNGRVVVLELFNVGAQVPVSAGPETAFDALLKTYPSSDVVLLQYHPQFILGIDPLSSPDGDARWNYYRRLFADKIKSSLGPTAIFNGKGPKTVGGGVDVSRSRYQGFSEGLSIWFDAEAGPKLKLTATEKEGKIDIQATVNDLEEPGKDKRLRLVLVEESVHYAGASGIRIHNRVVRSMPGGPAGFTLKEANSKQTATVDLAELKKQLADYLEEVYKKRPTPDREGMAGRPLPIEKRPLELKNLKLVALVQDDKTGEILQAGGVDLGAGKTEK
jgi:RNA polymerase sigma factor (sigma-70 family)